MPDGHSSPFRLPRYVRDRLLIGAVLLPVAAALSTCGCLDRTTGGGTGVATPVQAKKPTRDEFRARIMDKTPDEVIAAIGKPVKTSERGRSQNWYYENCCVDPVTGNVDNWVQLVIEEGRVVRVNF